jgi:hypothetical protein
MPDSIAQRLTDLPQLNKSSLCDLWKEFFQTPQPLRLRRRLIIQILAYRMQEQAFGSLNPATRGRLLQLVRALEANSTSIILPTRSLKPGTRLVRQWRDQVHLVNVEADGYEYQGARFQSLSEIARLITGTRWSGPLFFGIKSEQVGTNNNKEIQ